MKKMTSIQILCICWLFSLPVVGQDKSEWSNQEKGIIILSFDDSSNVTIYQNFTVINMLALYDEYEKECYADSTFVISHGWPFREITVVNDTLDYGSIVSVPAIYIQRREWTHRTPTFQGFIEFLRKYGEGKKSE